MFENAKTTEVEGEISKVKVCRGPNRGSDFLRGKVLLSNSVHGHESRHVCFTLHGTMKMVYDKGFFFLGRS